MSILSILAAVLALGFIIFFHELGHFLAAKACGVGVLEFSIGMGPRIVSGVYKNTRYSLKLLPLGGSCAMLGEDAAGSGDFSTAQASVRTQPKQNDAQLQEQERKSDDIISARADVRAGKQSVSSGNDTPDAEAYPSVRNGWADYDGVRYRTDEVHAKNFQNHPAWQRFIICIAGVAFNFLLAFLLSAAVIGAIGYDRATVVSVTETAPAAQAGLAAGDEVTGLIDQNGKVHAVGTYRDVSLFMMLHADEIDGSSELGIRFVRDGKTQTVMFLPYFSQEQNRYMLGITFNARRTPVTSLTALLKDSAHEVGYNVTATIESLKMMAKGRVKSNEVMGPVGTVAVIGDTVQESSRYGLLPMLLVLANLCVLLSANLGVMNLLPIPALDGGRLLFILIEMVTRRRMNERLEGIINAAGMIFLLVLMALIMGNDIKNLITGAYG